MRRTSGGAEQPVIDHVRRFELRLWGRAEPPAPSAIPEWFPTYGPLAPLLAADDERDGWPAGENCTLAVDGAGLRAARLGYTGPAGSLVELTALALTDGPWCADAADAERFDADLLRLVRVELTLEVAPLPDADRSRVVPLVLSSSVTLRGQ
jgi:hypothetical protein